MFNDPRNRVRFEFWPFRSTFQYILLDSQCELLTKKYALLFLACENKIMKWQKYFPLNFWHFTTFEHEILYNSLFHNFARSLYEHLTQNILYLYIVFRNKLVKLGAGVFRNNRKLERLELQGNAISFITRQSFTGQRDMVAAF